MFRGEEEDLDGATVNLDSTEEEESIQIASRSLVGKILTEKPLNKGAVKSILQKAWGNPKGLRITDMGVNVFLFTFKQRNEVNAVMRKAPWHVMNHLISLQFWIPTVSVLEIDYALVPFWVQIHGLPLGAMNSDNAVKTLSRMGEVLEVENPMVDGTLVRPFIRAWVKMDITKPLPTGCWVPRKNLPKTWIFFKYERLQDLCFNCGVIGHQQKNCRKEKAMAAYNNEVPRYGATLGVPPAKSLTSIVQEQGSWSSKEKAYETMTVKEDGRFVLPKMGVSRSKEPSFEEEEEEEEVSGMSR